MAESHGSHDLAAVHPARQWPQQDAQAPYGYAVLFFARYNLCRRHESLKGATQAMAAGMTGKVWTIRVLLERAA